MTHEDFVFFVNKHCAGFFTVYIRVENQDWISDNCLKVNPDKDFWNCDVYSRVQVLTRGMALALREDTRAFPNCVVVMESQLEAWMEPLQDSKTPFFIV